MARRLLREILLNVADLAALRFDHDVVIATFRNRTARGQRCEPRTAPRAHVHGYAVMKNFRRRTRDPLRRRRRHLIEQPHEPIAFEGREIVGAAQHLEQIAVRDFLLFGSNRDDLLRQHIHSQRRHFNLVHPTRVDRTHGRRTFDQVVEVEREETALGHRARPMARASYPLNRRGDPFRRIDLTNEINRTHVDAEFE